jgi:predicted GNAT family N-acyltransferase
MHIEQVPPYVVWPIRHRVMYPNLDFDSIKLEQDEHGIHLALFDGNELKSVVSLFIDGESLQFRKLATVTDSQGKGYGSAMIKYIIEFAIQENMRLVWCNARQNVLEFYRKFGFRETSKRFWKDGLEFVVVILPLYPEETSL